jgi:hypothetical protein
MQPGIKLTGPCLQALKWKMWRAVHQRPFAFCAFPGNLTPFWHSHLLLACKEIEIVAKILIILDYIFYAFEILNVMKFFARV